MNIFGFAICITLWASFIFAQTDTGSITGKVQDQEGNPVSGVTVIARDVATGIETEVIADDDGLYHFPSLRPGIYDIAAQLPGYGVGHQDGITVNVGVRLTADLVLLPLSLQEEMEVSGTPVLDTTQSHIGGLVTGTQIQNLPLNGRNFLELAFLVPGNAPGPTSGRGTAVAAAGNSGARGNILIDGMENIDEFNRGNLQNFPEDSIAEFQVLTRFSADVGRSGSNAIKIITKNGTNKLHGNAFLFYRDDSLQKKNPLLEKEQNEPSFNRKQFGFSSGGPIVKDRAFWFGALEYRNENSIAPAGRRDPSGPSILLIQSPTPLDDLLFTIRGDYKHSDANQFFGRYSLQSTTSIDAGEDALSDPSNFQQNENRYHSGVIGWTATLSNRTLNDLRVAEINSVNSSSVRGEAPELIFPSITSGKSGGERTRMNRFQVKDDFTWTLGRHWTRFGGEYQREDSDMLLDLFGGGLIILAEDFPTEDLNHDGLIDDNDIPVLRAIHSGAEAIPFVPNIDNNYVALYLQDDWRVRDNLTLNLGLRYDLDTHSTGANELNLKERLIFYPDDTGERHRDTNNWGPRLGFAWDVKNNANMVVRGGYGIYYDRFFLRATWAERFFNTRRLPIDIYGESLLGDPFGGVISHMGTQAIILSNRLEIPRVQQFSLGWEGKLYNEMTLSIDYAGIRGDHFPVFREVNHPRENIQINPNMAESVRQGETIADLSYDGLLISASKRLGKNLTFQASYTLARTIDWPTDAFEDFLDAADPSRNKGRAEFQDTHRFVSNAVYRARRGWKISGIFTYASGIPFDIITNQDFLGDGTPDRFPLLPRNAAGREVKTGAELNEWITLFNTSKDPSIVAMRNQCECLLPLVDPNLRFTDNFLNLDLRFSKITYWGRYTLEPIIEFFNIFNVTNIRGTSFYELAGYQRNLESSEFGKPVSLAGGVFSSGGPFAVQLALKFGF